MEIPFVRELLIAADIKDISGKDIFFNKVHFGAELDMEKIAIRCGINQGYPTYGFGINLSILHIDYAYLTEEWGYYPGQNPNSAHIISVRTGFKF